MQYHHSGADSVSTIATNPLSSPLQSSGWLIDGGCVALSIVVLLLGRKYFDFGASQLRMNTFAVFGRKLVTLYRPQVFHLALSRPQLGVIRI